MKINHGDKLKFLENYDTQGISCTVIERINKFKDLAVWSTQGVTIPLQELDEHLPYTAKDIRAKLGKGNHPVCRIPVLAMYRAQFGNNTEEEAVNAEIETAIYVSTFGENLTPVLESLDDFDSISL